MKRAIKFRGKRLTNDEWCYGSLLIWADGDCYILEKSDSSNAVWKREIASSTVGQFTGLCDANGEEIYEGDIIESNFGGGMPTRHIVAYDPKEAAFVVQLIGTYPNSGSIRQSWIDQYGKRIAGNIHDNPELLKGGDQ